MRGECEVLKIDPASAHLEMMTVMVMVIMMMMVMVMKDTIMMAT